MSEKRKEFLRTVKFALFSISAGIIQIIFDVLCNELLRLPAQWSSLIALIASVLWNFTLNRKYTFSSANNVPIAMLQVALFYAVFAPLSTWWTAVLTGPKCGWNEYVVLGLTMATNFITEYPYQRFVVFRKSLDTNKK